MATERALPAVSVGARPLPRAVDAPRPTALPRTRTRTRPAVAKKEAILNTPARAGMLFGASAAIYAVTLAGVAGLQAQTDASIAAQRQPYVDSVAQARAANDALEATIAQANAEISAMVKDYSGVGPTVTAFQARLDSLAALVADVQGSAAALPTHISLPTVSMAGSVGGARSSGGGTTIIRSTVKTTAKTTASGG